ncbi:cysteine-rich venom protein-like [Centruroides vittatus]|uniref:cysteine-rich venom protein-like n=1 Tax=Centruroides vittatus TaxID=120091 RepID=UPI00351071D5
MIFAILILSMSISEMVMSQSCPAIYRRLSKNHSYCMSSTCKVVAGGKVSESDKQTILKVHNELRSKLATGKETQYQKLPSAANMMQMEWDDELAAIAQAHANQCKFDHDSGDQRAVGNFSVGQNLFQSAGSLSINWNGIKMWYTSEVKYFHPEYNNPFQFHGNYGHFSQVIWAKTFKVGCGVAGYEENGVKKVLYTCNYGPAGNLVGSEAYKVGSQCSACPKNTKCSDTYQGLCKSLTPDGPQPSRPSSSDYLLYCDFSNEDPQACKDVKMTGSRSFSTQKLYTGKYVTAVFNAGEKMTINFGKFQHKDGLCAFFIGRFGPNVAGEKAGSFVSFHFAAPGLIFPDGMKDTRISSSWHTIGILMQSDTEMEVFYTFEVNAGAPPQYFEFKEYGVKGGKCP